MQLHQHPMDAASSMCSDSVALFSPLIRCMNCNARQQQQQQGGAARGCRVSDAVGLVGVKAFGLEEQRSKQPVGMPPAATAATTPRPRARSSMLPKVPTKVGLGLCAPERLCWHSALLLLGAAVGSGVHELLLGDLCLLPACARGRARRREQAVQRCCCIRYDSFATIVEGKRSPYSI